LHLSVALAVNIKVKGESLEQYNTCTLALKRGTEEAEKNITTNSNPKSKVLSYISAWPSALHHAIRSGVALLYNQASDSLDLAVGTLVLDQLVEDLDAVLLLHQLAIFFWINLWEMCKNYLRVLYRIRGLYTHLRQIGQGPDSPMLALGRLVAAHQTQDRLKAAVVDVSLALDVPPLDGGHHALQHVLPAGRLDRPGIGSVRGNVRQHSSRIVADLEAQVSMVSTAHLSLPQSRHQIRTSTTHLDAITQGVQQAGEHLDEFLGHQLGPQPLDLGHVAQEAHHVPQQLVPIREGLLQKIQFSLKGFNKQEAILIVDEINEFTYFRFPTASLEVPLIRQ